MPQDAGKDALTDIKRQREVADRPNRWSAPVPKPPELHEFSNTSYKMAAPKSAPVSASAKPKSDLDKSITDLGTSLKWNAEQRKALE